MIKKLMLALALATVMGSAQSVVLLTEDFDNVDALRGNWVFENKSRDPGVAPGWVQGNSGVFDSHEGDPNAYIASDFNVATDGGFLDDRLFTPLFSLENGAVATFWLRGANTAGFSDFVVYGYTAGSTEPSDFIVRMRTVAPTDDWTQFTITIDPRAGDGRLGFVHTGPQATANYVGLDTLRINSLVEPAGVPEPASLMIMGLGIAGLTLARRRR